MTELYVFCEGPTEQGFCKQVLGPHLWQFSCFIRAILVGHSRRHGIIHRGGIGKYETLRFDIQNHDQESEAASGGVLHHHD